MLISLQSIKRMMSLMSVCMYFKQMVSVKPVMLEVSGSVTFSSVLEARV